jgi:hypothetical protein
MSEMAESKEGAKSGMRLIDRKMVLPGMQLLVKAYANTKAKGNTMKVTKPETHTLFQRLCNKEGD